VHPAFSESKTAFVLERILGAETKQNARGALAAARRGGVAESKRAALLRGLARPGLALALACAGCSGSDTVDATECTEEGHELFAKQLGAACCQGLTRLEATEPTATGCSEVPPDLFICTRCGDGHCGPGENRCNCPDDCP
jgi:hypothetical protein